MAQEIKSALMLNGQTDPEGYTMIAALVKGRINGVPSAHLEFGARDKNLDLGKLVGTDMGFWVEDEDSKRQPFWGTCISAEAKGTQDGMGVYVAEIRPWLWFLTRSRNNRIYQEMTTTDIVKDILLDYGFSGDLKVKHSGGDPTREYCVQYRETDLDFIRRLLEEDGFYFYFEHGDQEVTMILADEPSTHQAASAEEKYVYSDSIEQTSREMISHWYANEKTVTGKVTLREYDFTKPSSDLTATSELQSGAHGHKEYESYQYPGRYKVVSDGEKRAAALIEEAASSHQTWDGVGAMINLNVGSLFEIDGHPRHKKAEEKAFMVTQITQVLDVGGHRMSNGSALRKEIASGGDLDGRPGNGSANGGANPQTEWMQTHVTAVMKSKPFRGPAKTRRPEISGVQTAIVTGKSGEEIWVDKYGRIKVQFHWDRDGKKDEKTTCWVRTMMPWTGKNWGMVGLPRVGQEVVIQFEEGDPDRPLCIGMLYNAETMPPYELPGNATRTGIMTNTSKGGGGYNELMFEDKKDEQLVRFMAEKDYVQNIQNQAHIKVGYPHETDVKKAKTQGDESLKVEVKQHYDEIVEEGDHSMKVSDGKQVLYVKKDKEETLDKNSTLTVMKDMKTTVSQGNQSTTVSLGNISVDADAGKIEITAATSITLTCGPSSIKLDPKGVTIKGVMISSDAQATLQAKSGGIAEVKSSGPMTIAGLPININ